jgi:uncharacterized membrane protein
MSVRSVVFSAKFSDLFIPLVLIPFTVNFDIYFYLFSTITSLLFIPFIITARKETGSYKPQIVLLIVFSLCFQAFVNSFFNVPKISNAWLEFMSVFIVITFHRLLITLTFLCTRGYFREKLVTSFRFFSAKFRPNLEVNMLSNMNQNSAKVMTKRELIDQIFLMIRAFIACVSQGAFFYSITRSNGNDVWPILNISPFLASLFAYQFLKEKFGKLETLSAIGVFFIFSIYVLTKG